MKQRKSKVTLRFRIVHFPYDTKVDFYHSSIALPPKRGQRWRRGQRDRKSRFVDASAEDGEERGARGGVGHDSAVVANLPRSYTSRRAYQRVCDALHRSVTGSRKKTVGHAGRSRGRRGRQDRVGNVRLSNTRDSLATTVARSTGLGASLQRIDRFVDITRSPSPPRTQRRGHTRSRRARGRRTSMTRFDGRAEQGKIWQNRLR